MIEDPDVETTIKLKIGRELAKNAVSVSDELHRRLFLGPLKRINERLIS